MGGAACSGSLRTLQDVTSCMPQDAGRHNAGVQFWGDVYAYDHADYKCETYIHLVHWNCTPSMNTTFACLHLPL